MTQVVGMPTIMLNCDVTEQICSMTSRPSSTRNISDIQISIHSHTFEARHPLLHLDY